MRSLGKKSINATLVDMAQQPQWCSRRGTLMCGLNEVLSDYCMEFKKKTKNTRKCHLTKSPARKVQPDTILPLSAINVLLLLEILSHKHIEDLCPV